MGMVPSLCDCVSEKPSFDSPACCSSGTKTRLYCGHENAYKGAKHARHSRKSNTMSCGKGITVICDKNSCVQGKYKPSGGITAHMRLADAAGIIKPTIGGSIKPDGEIALRSRSVNIDSIGQVDAAGTKRGDWAAAKMKSCDLYTVKEFKAKSSQCGSRGTREYVDNAANRKMGRVGKHY